MRLHGNPSQGQTVGTLALELDPPPAPPADDLAGLSSDELHVWRAMAAAVTPDRAGYAVSDATTAQTAFAVRLSRRYTHQLQVRLEARGLIAGLRQPGVATLWQVRVLPPPSYPQPGAPAPALTRAVPSRRGSPPQRVSPWAREAHVPRSPSRQAAHVGRAGSRYRAGRAGTAPKGAPGG